MTLPPRISAIIRKPSYLSSKTQPGSSNGASVSVASIGCRRLGRVDVRLMRGKFHKSALRNAWTSFKDEGTLQDGAMFRGSRDNRGAGVGYRCSDIDGQKTRDLSDAAGLLRPC